MKSTLCSVGDIIDAQCSKCRKVTNHVIVAMIDIKPVKVQCNTCNGVHRYRQPVSTPRTARQGSTPRKQEESAGLQTPLCDGLARDYDLNKEFRAGDVIRHLSFGLGLVHRVLGSRKMEVLFEDGRKILRCK